MLGALGLGSWNDPGHSGLAWPTTQAINYCSMDDITFDDFAGFIREFWHVPARKPITLDTQFERDLGLTGDDGDELLLATQARFGVHLGSEENGIRETFNLGPNEYLFHSEGWELFPSRLVTLFGSANDYTVRSFTVGELFEAVLKARRQ